jgi:hypothetical protein
MKTWDDLTLAELWQEEEISHAASLYYEEQYRDSKGDPGSGFYEFRDLSVEAHDRWVHAQYLLQAVASLIRGW